MHQSSPRRSPGYYRRLKKHRDAREKLNSFNENFKTPSLVVSEEDTEETGVVATEEVMQKNLACADSSTGGVIAEVSTHSEVQDGIAVTAETEDAVEAHSELRNTIVF